MSNSISAQYNPANSVGVYYHKESSGKMNVIGYWLTKNRDDHSSFVLVAMVPANSKFADSIVEAIKAKLLS